MSALSLSIMQIFSYADLWLCRSLVKQILVSRKLGGEAVPDLRAPCPST
jgi:hypothetical protein